MEVAIIIAVVVVAPGVRIHDTKRLSAVRWGVAKSILTAWVLTFPAAAGAAALCYRVAHHFLP